jgi:hypothetical protein
MESSLMALTQLLSAVTATGAGTTYHFGDDARRSSPQAIVHAIISATATATLQGSLDGTNWFTVYAFTSTSAQLVDLAPYMRGNCTAYTSGTVSLLLDYVAR